jgi:hypothetical protein
MVNCVDVEEHKTKIETAKEGESIMATHVTVCRKTYFVKNRVGDMVPITASGIYRDVKGFIQDLIAGK